MTSPTSTQTVRLVAITAERAEWLNDLRMWCDAEAKRTGLDLWTRHADNLETIFQGFERGITEEEARAGIRPYNALNGDPESYVSVRQQVAARYVAKLRKAFPSGAST